MDPFEQSADMRLLELQRKALGKAPPPPPTWSGTSTDMHEAIPLEETPVPVLAGARLLADLSASPKTKLVPGAVVTLSLSLQNAGTEAAKAVRVSVPVPGNSTFREGSLRIDEREASASVAEALLGEGYLYESLAAGQRTGLTWKISIEKGAGSLVVAPRVTASNASVTGSASVLLRRSAPAKSATLPKEYLPAQEQPERPFYELEPDEELALQNEFPAVDLEARPSTPLFVMPDIIPEPEPQPQPQPEPLPRREPQAQPQPEPVAPAQFAAPPPEPAQPTEPEAVAVQMDSPRLFSRFDAASLALVKKLFAAESFGQIPHYILQNSLAVSVDADGQDAGMGTHFSQQAGLLSRALLMHKLGKPMNVSHFAGGKMGFSLDATPRPIPAAPPSRLYMGLNAADVEFCAPVEERNPLESFIRIRQLAVALQARRVSFEDDEIRATAEALLEAYAKAARAAINRTFIRAKLDKNFDPFGAADSAADELARGLVDILERIVTA